MMPRTLFVDWTREIVGRDYLWQTMLDGLPAPDGLAAYHQPQWAAFYCQLGVSRTPGRNTRSMLSMWLSAIRYGR